MAKDSDWVTENVTLVTEEPPVFSGKTIADLEREFYLKELS